MTLPINWDRYTYDAVAIENHDGDTLRLKIDLGFGIGINTDFIVRLLGIQAPEVAGPLVSAAEISEGLIAKNALHQMLFDIADHPWDLVVETVKDQKEGRGRYLATLYDKEHGTCLNDEMVFLGYACRYDGNGKAPKWIAHGQWRTSTGVVIGADGKPIGL